MRTRIFVVLPMFLSFHGAAAPLPMLAMQAITPMAGLHFGSIVPQAGSSCSINQSSTVSGDCDISDGNIRTGQLQISDLSSDSDIQIQVTGTDNGQLRFVSTTDISGAVGGPSTVNDDVPALVTTDGTGSPIDLIIYGQISVVSNISAGQSHTVNYNVSVTYQ
jgi:hypothetical protein